MEIGKQPKREILQIMPAHGWEAAFYVGLSDPGPWFDDVDENERPRPEETHKSPVLMWALVRETWLAGSSPDHLPPFAPVLTKVHGLTGACQCGLTFAEEAANFLRYTYAGEDEAQLREYALMAVEIDAREARRAEARHKYEASQARK